MASSPQEEGVEQEINGVEASLGIMRLSGPQENPTGATRQSTGRSTGHGSQSQLGNKPIVDPRNFESFSRVMAEQAEEEKILTGDNAVELDLSAIRGIQPPEENVDGHGGLVRGVSLGAGIIPEDTKSPEKEQDLEALAELVPGLKAGKIGKSAVHENDEPINGEVGDVVLSPEQASLEQQKLPHLDSMAVNQGIDEEYEQDEAQEAKVMNTLMEEEEDSDVSSEEDSGEEEKTTTDLINSYQQKPAPAGVLNESSSAGSSAGQTHASDPQPLKKDGVTENLPPERDVRNNNNVNRANPNPYHNFDQDARDIVPATPPRDVPNDESYYGATPSPSRGDYHPQSSAASFSTATQSHEVRMPMYLPNFRPATGCTNASDFIVRCFVARLRAGITVVKHGRSRWCKSRLRVLHVHTDGRSLSWRPAQGEPSSNKRPPKLDLSTCLEVRHAWSPDPLNPMFTGTPILRSKCEASNAFKSFALIFPRRTVDITAVTADQCKVLMEGFSALCFRLQVANMAGRGRGMVNAEGEGDKEDVKMTATTAPSGR